ADLNVKRLRHEVDRRDRAIATWPKRHDIAGERLRIARDVNDFRPRRSECAREIGLEAGPWRIYHDTIEGTLRYRRRSDPQIGRYSTACEVFPGEGQRIGRLLYGDDLRPGRSQIAGEISTSRVKLENALS